MMDDMLRDRLVCGVNDSCIQRRLLAEPDLTLKKAMDLAVAVEFAGKDAHDLQTPRLPVHTIRRKEESRGAACYRCGGDHLAADCRFKDSQCYYCKKKGHLAKVCRSKAKAAKAKPRQGTSSRAK